MDIPLRKVTARLDHKGGNTYARIQPTSRPGSPTTNSPNISPHFRPKAKVNSSATVRKLSSSSSLATALSNDVASPSVSRPASPFKSSRTVTSAGTTQPKARITARPTSKSGSSQPPTSDSRQRSLTTVSSKLKLQHSEDRPRSGSVTLHHALSTSDLKPSSSPVGPQPSPLSDRSFGDSDQARSPLLAPAKIRSKVTGLAKPTNSGDPSARSTSPPWATTRPIHPRARAPSITSNFPFNDSPTPSHSPVLYPITTTTPAANPHRYAVARRAHSPFCDYQSFNTSSEASVDSVRRAPLATKVDPTSIPLPPQSPPVSAISLSSKSSISRTSVSLNSDQHADKQANGSTGGFHAGQRSNEGKSSPNFSFQSRNRDDGQEHSGLLDRYVHYDSQARESDMESEGSERHLKAEAKTNRKIEDLEITNRSLLAINASLETTKDRQAKEIRDLRRKLRESRLILPPGAYRAVKSAVEEDAGDDELDDDDDSEDFSDGAKDVTFHRVRVLLESLIETGKSALEKKPGDFRESLATKVLNAEELRFWHVSGQHPASDGDQLDSHAAEVDDETIHNHLSSAYIAMPGSDSESSPRSEQAGFTLDPGPRSVALPPITITHPP
ncbi:hypothetical protein F5I97DRAFT_1191395 [Phlebopus sp. FC_14]|nr:hypothetical protein F5I97DRAFT_1191395 [Phlebopus sp. FC_14]